jgi:integrase
MARRVAPLTAQQVKLAKPQEKDYKLFDGGGLFLLVKKTGGKLWRLKYRMGSKEKLLSLGGFPEVSLVQARQLREAHKADIAAGIDPAKVRKESKRTKEADKTKTENTFENIARERLEKVRDTISEAHYARQLTAFENDAFPLIGSKPVDEVTAPDIVALLHRMEKRGAKESARKLFYSISKTFKWAVANGKAPRNPAADIDLSELLGGKAKNSYPTITDDEGIGKLLKAIDGYRGDFTTRAALKMAPYVFVRPFNLRHAEWVEFDLKEKRWTIPGDKMKTGHDLIVALTDSVIAILEEVRPFTGDSRYVFPSVRSKTSPMSENTLNAALRRLGYTKDEIVSHGFRAMFSTVANEKSDFDRAVIDTQLAHSIGNSVSRAYNRAQYLRERVKLMQWWSDYLDELKGSQS